jgi:hypothetical protein
MNIAAELLDGTARREARHIDEKLFLEMCAARRTLRRGRLRAGQ